MKRHIHLQPVLATLSFLPLFSTLSLADTAGGKGVPNPKWPARTNADSVPLHTYAEFIKLLKSEADRDHVLLAVGCSKKITPRGSFLAGAAVKNTMWLYDALSNGKPVTITVSFEANADAVKSVGCGGVACSPAPKT